MDISGRRWCSEWGVCGGSLSSPRTSGLARESAKTLELRSEHEHVFLMGLGSSSSMDFPLFQLAVERVGTEDTGKGFLCDARITGAMLYGSKGCAAGQPSMGRVTTPTSRTSVTAVAKPANAI